MVKTTARKATLAACVAALIALMVLRAAGTVVAAEPPSGTPPDIFDPQADETPPTITRTTAELYESDRETRVFLPSGEEFDPDRHDVLPGQWVRVVVRISDGLLQSGVDADTVELHETSPQDYRHELRAMGSDLYEAWVSTEAQKVPKTWKYEFRAADNAGNKAKLAMRVTAAKKTTSTPSSGPQDQPGGTEESEEDNWEALFSRWTTLTTEEQETVKRVAKVAEDQGLYYDMDQEKYFQVCGTEGVTADVKKEHNNDLVWIMNHLPWLPGGKLSRCRDTWQENSGEILRLGGSSDKHDQVRRDFLGQRVWYYWDAYTGKYIKRRIGSEAWLPVGNPSWVWDRQFPRGDLVPAGKSTSAAPAEERPDYRWVPNAGRGGVP